MDRQREAVMELTAIDLFSGIGGFSIAATRAGFHVLAQVEIDDTCREYLASQWPETEQHGDIKTFDATRFADCTTLVMGGPPCQPASRAGKQRGAGDDRWLWPEALRVIRECRPTWACLENPVGIGDVGLAGVLAELEAQGYEVRVFGIPACAVGAAHQRMRYWIIGHRSGAETVGDSDVQLRRTDETVQPGRRADRVPASDGIVAHSNESGRQMPEPEPGATRLHTEHPEGDKARWLDVVWSADCDEDGNCPVCGTDYADCPCPGPTQDGYEYREQDGRLQAKAVADADSDDTTMLRRHHGEASGVQTTPRPDYGVGVSHGCGTGDLADATRRGLGEHGSAPRSAGHADVGCEDDAMGDTESLYLRPRSRDSRPPCERIGEPADAGQHGPLGDASRREDDNGRPCDVGGAPGAGQRSYAAAWNDGVWDGTGHVRCADPRRGSVVRRAPRGAVVLVDGVPTSLASALAEAGPPHRSLIAALGNSIVPEVAYRILAAIAHEEAP